MSLTFKYKRPTPKEYGHTEVYLKGEYLGYFMQNQSPARPIGQNWCFESRNPKVPYLKARNRNELIEALKKLL